MFSGAPDRAPVPGDPRVPSGASPSTSLVGAPLFYSFVSLGGRFSFLIVNRLIRDN